MPSPKPTPRRADPVVPRAVALICASPLPADEFARATYLGRSLSRIPPQFRPTLRLTPDNSGVGRLGLPEVYNHAIDDAEPDDILVFVHDDVYLNDWHVVSRVREGLSQYDVIGLAGSRNPDLNQPSWGLAFDEQLGLTGWQPGLERSGCVNHYDYGYPEPSVYGPTPEECILLDGLFLAAGADTLRSQRVRFDEQFAFHMYDLDFCRTAGAAGLLLGTWPISVTHDSRGAFETPEFRGAARRYLDKWQTDAA